ncbi:hypothetical protein HP398_22010 [Brevibacillus sp. HB1.4B]|uniref:hypothetical protein n=1 Tax=Brevibacillus sp. HB1.4B TaxID=2738845 RepID=UPI00156B3CE8|nr:hypothetical protein [Brevibacillus sp. HB1.4B]NRS19106.1 hypothetical protein [Brevibacillus sp. HB1.4B]
MIYDINDWAFSKDTQFPHQDWDLFITDINTAPLLLSLSINPKVAKDKRKVFLACLYLLVGDAVGIGKDRTHLEEVRLFVEQASSNRNYYIQQWVSRSFQLIQNPELFDYKKWCDGIDIFSFWEDYVFLYSRNVVLSSLYKTGLSCKINSIVLNIL